MDSGKQNCCIFGGQQTRTAAGCSVFTPDSAAVALLQVQTTFQTGTRRGIERFKAVKYFYLQCSLLSP